MQTVYPKKKNQRWHVCWDGFGLTIFYVQSNLQIELGAAKLQHKLSP